MRTNVKTIYDYTAAELEALLNGWGQPGYRARQLYRQVYVQYADGPQGMTDLPGALRERLADEVPFRSLELVREQRADGGLTRKALFKLPDGEVIESVLMVYPDRATVCVSTQAGCAMGCVFCATGRLGLLRNVTPGQILEQVMWAAREVKAMSATLTPQNNRLSNIVFMGMGEPFANYDRWWQAVERLHDPQGLNLGARSMTVSTVGLVPGIRRLADERLPINLAISLHAPDDALRSALMPVNNRYPIRQLMDATQYYIDQTHRRVSFEYVLLQGQNDAPEHAETLAKLLRGMLCHVNLIPWNPVPGMPLGRSEMQRVRTFQQVLLDHTIACTVRVERGIEIAAACGQLAGTPSGISLELAQPAVSLGV